MKYSGRTSCIINKDAKVSGSSQMLDGRGNKRESMTHRIQTAALINGIFVIRLELVERNDL